MTPLAPAYVISPNLFPYYVILSYMRNMLDTKGVVLECEPDDWPQTLAHSIVMIPASEG